MISTFTTHTRRPHQKTPLLRGQKHLCFPCSRSNSRAARNHWCRTARTVLYCSSNTDKQPQQQTGRRVRPTQLTNDDPLSLAFLGDAIWSLCVRNHFLNPPKHFRLYQSAVKPFITAEGQAQAYDALRSQQLLTQPEQQYLQYVHSWRGMKFRKRFSTPAAEDVYRKATALEALVGYLHLHDPDRLQAIVKAVLPGAATPASSSSATPDQSPGDDVKDV